VSEPILVVNVADIGSLALMVIGLIYIGIHIAVLKFNYWRKHRGNKE